MLLSSFVTSWCWWSPISTSRIWGRQSPTSRISNQHQHGINGAGVVHHHQLDTSAPPVDGAPFPWGWSQTPGLVSRSRLSTPGHTHFKRRLRPLKFQQERKTEKEEKREGGAEQTQSVMQDYSVSFSTAGDVFFYEGEKKTQGFSKCRDPCRPHAPLQLMVVGGAGWGWGWEWGLPLQHLLSDSYCFSPRDSLDGNLETRPRATGWIATAPRLRG